jgi:hypothetical protein
LLDDCVAFGGIGVGGEVFYLLGGGYAAGEIEIDPAEELFIGGKRRRGDILRLHRAKNLFVDEVAPWDGGGVAERDLTGVACCR